jgi:hypothetical protein
MLFHHGISAADDKKVIHMDHQEAIAILASQDAWVSIQLCHFQRALFDELCQVLIPK